MLTRAIRIVNLDESILAQKKLISCYQTEIIDLLEWGPSCRLWMNKKTKQAIEARLGGSSKDSVTFLGSGDFHHFSASLIAGYNEPFSLIVFDFHPDWDILPPRFGCGAWVTEALRNPLVKKCILAGISSEDISGKSLRHANLASLEGGRLEIYPYAHQPSSVFLRRIPENISIRPDRRRFSTTIHWDQLKGKNLQDFFQDLLRRIPTRKVYVSIDKDCLKKEYALTNWEGGLMPLEELLLLLELIKNNLDIIGCDITGDYSPVRCNSFIKQFISRIDHPKHIPAQAVSSEMITSVNQTTNLEILKTLIP